MGGKGTGVGLGTRSSKERNSVETIRRFVRLFAFAGTIDKTLEFRIGKSALKDRGCLKRGVEEIGGRSRFNRAQVYSLLD